MKGVWSEQRRAFKTYDGWTQYIETGKDTAHIEGMGDVLRFTDSEATRNSLPNGHKYVTIRGPIPWDYIRRNQ